MGRVSVEEQLKTIFQEDYNDLLISLLNKNFTPEEISSYIKSKFNIEIKQATVKIHIAKLKSKNNVKNDKSNSKSEKKIDYESVLKSLSHLDKDEISEKIKEDYGVEIKASTVYQYALKYGIKLPSKRAKKKKDVSNLKYLDSDLKGKHNQNLLINNLPLPPKKFHPTKHAGFVIYEDIDAIVEICGHLVIEDMFKSHIDLWLKVFKDDMVEETSPIVKINISKHLLETISEHNYVKTCKEICSTHVEEIQNFTTPQLRSALLVNCKNQKSMEKLLSKCHTYQKKS